MLAARITSSRPAAVRPAVRLATVCSAAPGASGPNSHGDDLKRGKGDQQRNGSSLRAASAPAQAAEGRPRRWSRGPGDTLLRDTNRDRLMGLLTERAAKTLLFYFSELNPTLMQWLEYFMRANPIPREGAWEDVSGETFLRKLLSMPLEETRWDFNGRAEMFSRSTPLGVDPRSIAQRIMEIRGQIAREWIEELKQVDEENALLMRETVAAAFTLERLLVADPTQFKGTHPELMHPDFEGSDG